MKPAAPTPTSATLHLDPIGCRGHGFCAQALSERITLDEWGYPLLPCTPVPTALRAHTRRAVATGPALALTLRHTRDS